MRTEVEIDSKEQNIMLEKIIHKANDERLMWILSIVKGEFNSRIAHYEENYPKYWDKKTEVQKE